MTSPAAAGDDNIFLRFWEAGYRGLVPIIPPDAELYEHTRIRPEARGKAVGVRRPDGLWMGFDWVRHETTASDLPAWSAMGCGVGIKTGPQPDGTWLIGVDADTLDRRCAAVISGEVRRRWGVVPTRVGREPKCLYVLRIDGPLQYARVEFGEGERIELLSKGRQFVAWGVHPTTRKPYEWVETLPRFEKLPVWPAEGLL
jgi:hypothetical protein